MRPSQIIAIDFFPGDVEMLPDGVLGSKCVGANAVYCLLSRNHWKPSQFCLAVSHKKVNFLPYTSPYKKLHDMPCNEHTVNLSQRKERSARELNTHRYMHMLPRDRKIPCTYLSICPHLGHILALCWFKFIWKTKLIYFMVFLFYFCLEHWALSCILCLWKC